MTLKPFDYYEVADYAPYGHPSNFHVHGCYHACAHCGHQNGPIGQGSFTSRAVAQEYCDYLNEKHKLTPPLKKVIPTSPVKKNRWC